MKKVISTSNAPSAIGPYSQAIYQNTMLFASGQIPIDPKTGALCEGGIREQSEQVMKNIQAVLQEAGLAFQNVVKTTCYLQNMEDFSAFNEVYAAYFTHKPARSCVAVAALPKGALVEVEVTAFAEEPEE